MLTSDRNGGQARGMLSRSALLLFMMLAVAGWLSCGGHSSHATHPAYVTVPASNHLVGFNIDNKSGALSAMSHSPFATGNAPSSVTVHPSKKFAYVANAGDATAALYTIGASNELTEVPPRVPTGASPIALAIDPAGGFLFAANAGSNSVSVYSINSGSGALSEISGSPFPTTSPLALALSPSGKFLYVANLGSNNVSGFTIDRGTGLPTQISGSPFAAGTAPLFVAVDPSGTFLFVGNQSSNNISGFTIDSSTGALKATSPSTAGTGAAPTSMFIS